MFGNKYGIRSVIAFIHDLIAVAASWLFAFLFYANFKVAEVPFALLGDILSWILPVQAVFFLWFGLYRGLWRYASLPDLKRITVTVLLSAALVTSVFWQLALLSIVPYSVNVLAPILLLLIMGGSRLIYRAWKERRLYSLKNYEGKLVLILGAGNTALNLVKDLASNQDWHVVGMLDDDPRKLDTRLHGVRVLGTIDDLPYWVRQLNVGHVIIAMPSLSHRAHRHILEMCSEMSVKAMIIPSYQDLINGKTTVSQIREIQLDDLLGREPVVLDDEGLHGLLTGKTILVTGAGGSIGAEYALYCTQEEFQTNFPDTVMSFVIGDIKDDARLQQIFAQYRPSVVFHAAAYKHVPLMEHENAWQAVLNNVMGTYILADTAIHYDVEKFVLVSTDKAVNPVNTMGASKRLAEMVCQAMQQSTLNQQRGTCFVMVRFGNVLGSAGSVIPKFRKQIAEGGPITVTHPDMTRYFMSIPEAAQLVLQAGLMGGLKGGGEIFVMDMGDPVKITELASDLVRLSGLGEDDIRIVFTGLRPGEKLHEELLSASENTVPTPHAKLRIAQAPEVNEQWLTALITRFEKIKALNDAEARAELARWVPEYTPNGDSMH
jgi:FlaA1/EpsC-like NDP-sugar epimerase